MKKVLIALMLAAALFTMTGCRSTIMDEKGTKRQLFFGRFISIEETKDAVLNSETTYLCYDKTTHIMYYILLSRNRAGISPCWIYDEEANDFHVGHWPEDWDGK